MKTFERTLIPTAVAVALAAPSAALAATEQAVSDQWVESKIATLFTVNEHINPFTVDVEVRHGVATLSGTVDSDTERELAVELAKGVEGVTGVTSQLRVEQSTQGQSPDNPLFTDISDATITAKVKTRLMWNSSVDGLPIDVATNDGWVTLSGSVDSSAEADLARALANNTVGVRGVYSVLAVTEDEPSAVEDVTQSARSAVTEMGREVDDGWISAKVTSAIMLDRRFLDSRVDVRTEDGVVNLEGEVASASQRDALIETVADVRGVRDVRSDISLR